MKIIEKILYQIEQKTITYEYLEKYNAYYVHANDLNAVLKIIFKIATKSTFSFSIKRSSLYQCDIDIFLDDLVYTFSIITTKNLDYNNVASKWYDIKLRLKQKMNIIPVIGPDGVGKTTLLAGLREESKSALLNKRFKKIVRRSIIYNVTYPITRYLLKRKLKQKPQKDQHDDRYPKMIVVAGLLYYPYLIFNALILRKVIFVDRFFQDYLLKDISFLETKTTLRPNWKMFLRFIPQTFWRIHLDAKAKVILARKDELSKRDIKKYRQFNFKMYLQNPSYVYTYINTGRSLQYCQNVLEKTARKHKLIEFSLPKVELNDDLLLAKGGERTCYIHPCDETKVIKVIHAQGDHNNQNELEYNYMNYITQKRKDLSCVAKCYDFVSTNKGKGIVFERIMDYDNSPSKSFRYMIANKLIPIEEQKKLIAQLKVYLESNLILFVDTSLTNIFCPKINEKEYKLVIVDGLGAKRMSTKFWLYRASKLYTQYKIKRQWAKFISMYERDVKRAELGQRPFTRV